MTATTVEPAATEHVKPSKRPLRIGMVAYTFYDSDNRVMRYAELLAQEGHDVEVFALRGDNPKAETVYGVKVFRLQQRLKNEKTQFDYAWRVLGFLLRSFWQLSKRQLKRRYDLIHVHSVPDFLVFCALIPRLSGTPVILDIHDILPEFYAGKFGASKKSLVFRLMCFVEWLSGKFSSHVIIANHIWKERLESRSVTPNKCSVVMNYPDRAIFQPSPEPGPKKGRFLFLYPGTLYWHQGLDIGIRAFAKISDRAPHADFHIYGGGPVQDSLLALIKELRLEGRVCIYDSKPIREIAHLMELADVGVVPKRKDNFGNEAFSTKIFEFMAMNVPVIVSDTSVDKYYFNDSLVRFFRAGDEDDLAHAMLDLIQHPEKRRALVENSREFIRKNDWTVKKCEYLDLVEDLTNPS